MPWFPAPEPPVELSEFTLHKLLYEVVIDDVAVPGLRAAFYRRAENEWIHSVGIYLLDNAEIFRAGGLAGAEHCSWHSVPRADGEVDGPHAGCPDVHIPLHDGAPRVLIVRTPTAEYRLGLARGTAMAR